MIANRHRPIALGLSMLQSNFLLLNFYLYYITMKTQINGIFSFYLK